jgi:hypothetical protein
MPGDRPASLLALALLTVPLLVPVMLSVALRPEPRSAWKQAALTKGLPEANRPDRGGLWSDQVKRVLAEAERLGPAPDDASQRRPWLVAQCALNQRLQALQRQYGRPVETAAAMGRPPACEELAELPVP